MGYAHKEFGCKLWDPENKKIIRSRDVTFLDDQIVDYIKKIESLHF